MLIIDITFISIGERRLFAKMLLKIGMAHRSIMTQQIPLNDGGFVQISPVIVTSLQDQLF